MTTKSAPAETVASASAKIPDVNSIMLDFTGEDFDLLESTLGGPLEESSIYKLTKAVAFVKHRAATDSKATWKDYNKRTLRSMIADLEATPVPNDD